jgi:hypothetical protein
MPRRGKRRGPRATDRQMRKLRALGIHYKRKPSRRLASRQIERAEHGIYERRAIRRGHAVAVRYECPVCGGPHPRAEHTEAETFLTSG